MARLKLPKANLKYLDDKIIEIEIPDNLIRANDFDAVAKAKGIWRDKEIDPAAYQNECRGQWHSRS